MRFLASAALAIIVLGPSLFAFDGAPRRVRPIMKRVESLTRASRTDASELEAQMIRLEALRRRYQSAEGPEFVAEERAVIRARIGELRARIDGRGAELDALREAVASARGAPPEFRARAADRIFDFSMGLKKMSGNARSVLEGDAEIFERAGRVPPAPSGPGRGRGPGPVRLLILAGLAAAVYLVGRWRSIAAEPATPAPTPPGKAPEPEAIGPGTVLDGNFRIEEELGRGGMGVVYAATDLALDRKVAIKCMLKEVGENAWELEQFLKEARLVAALKHPAVVEIYSIFRDGGRLFLVFERVDGTPLHRFLAGKPMTLRLAKRLLKQVAEALDYAHERKVIHRDLKPSNIMVTAEGAAKVMDFGIAHQAKMTVAKVTKAEAWGTPAYMAPEAELGTISRESDLYALGVCLYELLTGRAPFSGPNFLAQKQGRVFAPASRTTPGLPAEVDAVLVRAMDPDPAARFHTGSEFSEALEGISCES